MDKPNTYYKNLAHLPPALQPLTMEPRWLIWRWEQRTNKDGAVKWTKPPYQARYPDQHAKSDDPDTWGNHHDAVAAMRAGHADGIGYALMGSGIGAIDLDHCVDLESSEVEDWARQLLIEANGAYKETTVSGTGCRIIGKAEGDNQQRRFTFNRTTGAGIEIYRNTKRYITVSALERGSCAELPPLDSFIDMVLARHSGETKQQANGFDFNDAGRQDGTTDYDKLIRNGAPEGQRSEAFQSVIWHLASQGWSAEAITDEIAKHPNGMGAKYADRLHEEVTRSYEKWRARRRQSATGDAEATDTPWPQIFVVKGELPRIVNEAETALIGLGREIYQRGGQIVRPVLQRLKASDDRDTQGWQLVPVTQPDLVVTLTCAAQFLKYDARSKGWIPADAPNSIAEAYLASVGRWKLPILTAVTGAPFLRPDNSVCDTPGYDTATGLLYKPACSFPPIPPQPTRNDALAALAQLEELIADFPFVAPADRSVALAAILTTLDRPNMETAPLFAFTAPTAGTGKSKLVDIVSMLVTGQPAPVMGQGSHEEELEKRLGAALLAGNLIISIDNCEHILKCSFLCSALTQQISEVRVLGKSKNVMTPVIATMFATGNNLSVAGDLTRRTLLCSLDAQCERPELREFNQDAVEVAKTNRGRLVAAALTVLRGWHLSGRKGARPLGSFETWSHRVRDALLWLDRADPCSTTDKVKSDDPEIMALTAVMAQWREHIGLSTEVTVPQIVNRSLNAHDLHIALTNVASARTGPTVSNERLGRWLKKNEGRIIGGLVLRRTRMLDGYPIWSLKTVSGLSGL
jgi:hypothetical protein